jgi:hypothetical protein
MPALEDTTVVVLFFTPADVAVRFTLNVHVPAAGSDPVASATAKAKGPTDGTPPQVFATAGVDATITPGGNGSANVMRDNGAVGFGFVNLNVTRVTVPTRTVDGTNSLVSVGGNVDAPTTVNDAFAPAALDPWSVVSTLLALFLTPAVVPRTFTVTRQLDEAGMVPPISAIEPLPATALTDPPHELDSPFGEATTSPAGSVSVNAAPVSGDAVELARVNVKLVDASSATVGLPNALLMVGG